MENEDLGKLLAEYAREEREILDKAKDENMWLGACYVKEYEDHVGMNYR